MCYKLALAVKSSKSQFFSSLVITTINYKSGNVVQILAPASIHHSTPHEIRPFLVADPREGNRYKLKHSTSILTDASAKNALSQIVRKMKKVKVLKIDKTQNVQTIVISMWATTVKKTNYIFKNIVIHKHA